MLLNANTSYFNSYQIDWNDWWAQRSELKLMQTVNDLWNSFHQLNQTQTICNCMRMVTIKLIKKPSRNPPKVPECETNTHTSHSSTRLCDWSKKKRKKKSSTAKTINIAIKWQSKWNIELDSEQSPAHYL